MYFNKSLVYKRRNVFSIRLTNEIKIQVIKYDLSIKCITPGVDSFFTRDTLLMTEKLEINVDNFIARY